MSVNILVSTIVVMAVATSKASAMCCDGSSYPVALDDLGPRPCPLPVVGTLHTTPIIEKPVIRLPAVIPPARVLSNRCRCMKTIVKPQVIQQVINVPTLQRYIETSHRPVVEKIHYNAHPVNAPIREPYGACCRECSCGCQIPVAVRAIVPVAGVPYRRVIPVVSRCYERCACAC